MKSDVAEKFRQDLSHLNCIAQPSGSRYSQWAMNAPRLLIHALLGLVFLLQGFAVSAMPTAQPMDAAQEQADAPPCHGGLADMTAEMPADQASCCDDNCAGMVGCLLSHLALADPGIWLASPPGAIMLAERVVFWPRARSARLLRPPISLPA